MAWQQDDDDDHDMVRMMMAVEQCSHTNAVFQLLLYMTCKVHCCTGAQYISSVSTD
jgi:hypothetical protein